MAVDDLPARSVLVACQGSTEAQSDGEHHTPLNAAAFIQALRDMAKVKADPLSSDGYYNLLPTLAKTTVVGLLDATQKKCLASPPTTRPSAVRSGGLRRTPSSASLRVSAKHL